MQTSPYNLRQTIFRSKPNDFSIYWERFSDMPTSALRALPCRTPDKKETWVFSGEYSPLLHLPQTVFHPKRFASFRLLLYQRFKVNFLSYNPSPGFHRKTGCPHKTVFNKFAVALVFNTLRWRAWQRLFHVVYLQTRKHQKHKAYGLQKDCMHRRKTVERKTYGRKGEGRAP